MKKEASERGPQGERGLQGDSADVAPLEDDIKRIKETLKTLDNNQQVPHKK